METTIVYWGLYWGNGKENGNYLACFGVPLLCESSSHTCTLLICICSMGTWTLSAKEKLAADNDRLRNQLAGKQDEHLHGTSLFGVQDLGRYCCLAGKKK